MKMCDMRLHFLSRQYILVKYRIKYVEAIQKAKNSQKYLNYICIMYIIYIYIYMSSSFPSTTAQPQDSAF